MAYTSPITKIAIGFFRADQNYKNVFSNNEWLTDNDRNHAKSEQADYFWGKMKHRWDASVSSNKYNIVRHDEYIDLPVTYAPTYANCDYGMYCNQNLTVGSSNAKWIYFFITKTEYINSATTRLYIKTDVFQTYIFDVNFNPCKIIRNTVASDTYTYQKYSDYMPTEANYETIRDSTTGWSYYYMICCTEVYGHCNDANRTQRFMKVPSNIVDGIPYPYALLVCTTTSKLAIYLEAYRMGGKTSAIISITAIPKWALGSHQTISDQHLLICSSLPYVTVNSDMYQWDTSIAQNPDKVSFAGRTSSGNTTIDITPSTTLVETNSNSYTPKNKKMLCYPYFLLDANICGTNIKLDFKKSTQSYIRLKIQSHLSALPQFQLMTNYYNSASSENWENSQNLNLGFTIPWDTDKLAEYLNANSNKLNAELTSKQISTLVSVLSTVGAAAATVATGGAAAPLLVGTTASLVSSGANLMNYEKNKQATLDDLKEIPNTISSIANCNPELYYANTAEIHICQRQVNPAWVKDIDNYFSCFGYAIGKIEEPKLSNRTYWDYIQTENCIVEPYSISSDQGFMTNNELIEFANIFNNGVTVWHRETFDYSTFNNPIRT